MDPLRKLFPHSRRTPLILWLQKRSKHSLWGARRKMGFNKRTLSTLLRRRGKSVRQRIHAFGIPRTISLNRFQRRRRFGLETNLEVHPIQHRFGEGNGKRPWEFLLRHYCHQYRILYEKIFSFSRFSRAWKRWARVLQSEGTEEFLFGHPVREIHLWANAWDVPETLL